MTANKKPTTFTWSEAVLKGFESTAVATKYLLSVQSAKEYEGDKGEASGSPYLEYKAIFHMVQTARAEGHPISLLECGYFALGSKP